MRINLTIDDVNKRLKVDYLRSSGSDVIGTDYIILPNVGRLRDETDGWWFDRLFEAEFNRKIKFADIVNYNGSPIGSTTQADITAAITDAISIPDGAIVTVSGEYIVLSTGGYFVIS